MYAYDVYQELIRTCPNADRTMLLVNARLVVAYTKKGYVS